jgi:hypothetical protein
MFKIFSVTIQKRGKNPLQWYREVKANIYPELQNQLKLSADATAEIMQGILKNSGYKIDKLASAINVMVLNSTGGVDIGIGEIDRFPKGNDGRHYWNAFNEGWLPPENWGYWGDGEAPSATKRGQKWTHTGKSPGSFYMKPTKPIMPLMFVDKGYDTLVKHIEKEIEKFQKNLSNNTNT